MQLSDVAVHPKAHSFFLAGPTTNMPMQLGFIILTIPCCLPLAPSCLHSAHWHEHATDIRPLHTSTVNQGNSKLSCAWNSTSVFFLMCYLAQCQLVHTALVIDEQVWSRGCNDLQRWENLDCLLVQFDAVMVLLALKQVTKFKYLGSIITEDGKNKEI